ncbi:putative retrotransposon hot spot protein (RHS,) [Trypanosoma cruzi]|uniref:Putative retrotransposon hot spot protein (RHS,) n=1 Tax=Trypanosoma cruzi TaxID=5693 RepID=A0A2V2UG80_TRYCR|nr:putative retrotransposon hot spot protein (RHS,) [Trypanosoma cruzi]
MIKRHTGRGQKKHIYHTGLVSRNVFDANEFIAHSAAIEESLDGINSRDGEKHFIPRGVRLWYSEDPSQKLVRVVRERGEVGAGGFLNAPISVCFGVEYRTFLGNVMSEKGIFLLLVLWVRILFCLNVWEGLACAHSFWSELVAALVGDLKELGPPARRGGQYSLLKANPEGHPNDSYGLPAMEYHTNTNMKHRLLYVTRPASAGGHFFL